MIKSKLFVFTAMAGAIVLIMGGCKNLTALERFNEASDRLTAAESLSMSLETTMKYNFPESGDADSGLLDFFTQNIGISTDARYEFSEERTTENIKASKMAMEMTMNMFGEKMVVESYIKDGFMYMGIPSEFDEYIFIDMSDPEFDEISSSTASMDPDDFLINEIDEESVIASEVTIDFMGNAVDTECLTLIINEDSINQLKDLLGSTAETTSMDYEEMLEMIDLDDFIYKLYINDGNIIRLELFYSMGIGLMEEGETMSMSVSMVADIYDYNDTTIEYPDFSNAVIYSDF